jgi:HNH endonuclease
MNGLLLTANLHNLFDWGFIAFKDSGEMQISSRLSKEEQLRLGLVAGKLLQNPTPKTIQYLSEHRARFQEWKGS